VISKMGGGGKRDPNGGRVEVYNIYIIY